MNMNRFERRSRESYNKIADDYENTPDGRFTVKFKQALADVMDLTEDCVVLDIACGNGRLLKDLHQKTAIKGVGVDISEKMIEQAKRLNPRMEFQVSGCNKLPFADSFCDIATICASFHHFPDVNVFAKEIVKLFENHGFSKKGIVINENVQIVALQRL